MTKQPLTHNSKTGEFFIGNLHIFNLTPIHRRLLATFLNNPNTYLTKTALIESAWPSITSRQSVSDAALYQQICTLRNHLRLYTPHSYITTWRGDPEGGYRLG